MLGYFILNPDWTYRGVQYIAGKTFAINPEKHSKGIPFCIKAVDCFQQRRFNPCNKVTEGIVLGSRELHTDGIRWHTDKFHIIREVQWRDILEQAQKEKSINNPCPVNDKWNENIGMDNSGCRNFGAGNSGDDNSGNWNSGNSNIGISNSGSQNGGNGNSGNFNKGDGNSGCYNWGIQNSGSFNDGYRNSGNFNKGDNNSGHYNNGDYNCGDWNQTSNVVGCFNTKRQKLYFFDKETDITFSQWRKSEAWRLLSKIPFRPVAWKNQEDMTKDEKAAHPSYNIVGGYLEICENPNQNEEWWDSLSDRERNVIRQIPNFDPEKFFKITGIKA